MCREPLHKGKQKGWENALGSAVHEVKVARVLVEDLGNDPVLPELVYRLRDVRGEVGVGCAGAGGGVEAVVEDALCEGAVGELVALEAELAHVDDDGVGGVEDVLVDDGAVLGELAGGEAVLVDDLHLLDDGGLAGLAGACGGGVGLGYGG